MSSTLSAANQAHANCESAIQSQVVSIRQKLLLFNCTLDTVRWSFYTRLKLRFYSTVWKSWYFYLCTRIERHSPKRGITSPYLKSRLQQESLPIAHPLSCYSIMIHRRCKSGTIRLRRLCYRILWFPWTPESAPTLLMNFSFSSHLQFIVCRVNCHLTVTNGPRTFCPQSSIVNA